MYNRLIGSRRPRISTRDPDGQRNAQDAPPLALDKVVLHGVHNHWPSYSVGVRPLRLAANGTKSPLSEVMICTTRERLTLITTALSSNTSRESQDLYSIVL
jgi:hypothetical protein